MKNHTFKKIFTVLSCSFTICQLIAERGSLPSAVTRAVHPTSYYSYTEAKEKLHNYITQYPTICRLEVIGQSVLGRDIYALKISDFVATNELEPNVTLNSTIHGNESVCTEVSFKLIDYLLSNYNSDPRITNLINNNQLYFLPITNPDGVVSVTRENNHGKDLNRSFPDGVENDIGNIYDGPQLSTVGREAETAVLMTWHASKNFAISACLHSGTVMIVYPYGNNTSKTAVHSAAPDDLLFKEICLDYVNEHTSMNSSHVVNGAVMYPITGEMADWKYRYLGTLAVTIELSYNKEPSDTEAVWLSHKESLLTFLESAQQGVHGSILDAGTGEPIRAKISLIDQSGHDFYSSTNGYFNRPLQAGTYSLTISAEGYASTQESITVTSENLLKTNFYLEDSFIIRKGWNQLSIPWPITDTVKDQLFVDRNTAWVMEHNAYKRTTNLTTHTGFWLYSYSERSITINKRPEGFAIENKQLPAGWHLVGPSRVQKVWTSSKVFSTAWNWDGEKYSNQEWLKRCYGYWLYVFEDTQTDWEL